MKKVLPFLLLSLLMLMVGCEVSGSAKITINDSITLLTLSSVKDKVSKGSEVDVYFGFTASEYLTQENVNIVITDASGKNVTKDFGYEKNNFSEKAVSASDKKCSFTLQVPTECEDGLYTVKVDLILGSVIQTVYYALQVGEGSTITISELKNSIMAGSSKMITTTVANAPHLTKDAFTVSMHNAGSGNVPTITVDSYVNGLLTLKLSATNVVSGTYTGTLSILSEQISQNISITVTDLAAAEIESIKNITLKEGETKTTTAKILNWTGLTTSDFTVTVAGSGTSSSFIKEPTATVTSFSNGTATITIDARSATVGTFIGTLEVEGNSKGFTIVVEEDANKQSITIDSATPATINIDADQSYLIRYEISASEVVTEKAITVTFKDDLGQVVDDYFSYVKSTFSAQYTYIHSEPRSTVTITAKSDCPSGTYTMSITGTLGTSSSTQKVTIMVFAPMPTITFVQDVTVDAGSVITTTATIANGSNVFVGDFFVTFPSSINTTGTAPMATVSRYSNGVATISINAENATAGSYTGTLVLGADSKNFTVTVEEVAVALTEKSLMLYNPFGSGNSAWNFVDNSAVAAIGFKEGTGHKAGKMVLDYSAADSLRADIGLDNDQDIRDSKIVTELTSLNGGLFKVTDITSADYESATDISLKALCADIHSGSDNEVLMFDVGEVFAMKLGNGRGYVIFKITSIDPLDTEGSSSNTGKMGINYKFTAM